MTPASLIRRFVLLFRIFPHRDSNRGNDSGHSSGAGGHRRTHSEG